MRLSKRLLVIPLMGLVMLMASFIFISGDASAKVNAVLTDNAYKIPTESTAVEKIGLGNQGYSPHKLRHTAATLMYQKGGVDIRTLQVILGHSNLGTTQIYTHIADEQIQKGLNANPLANV